MQLEGEGLQYASDILGRAVAQVSALANQTQHVDKSLIALTLEGTGNILGALAMPDVARELNSVNQGPYLAQRLYDNREPSLIQRVVTNSTIAIHTILKVSHIEI